MAKRTNVECRGRIPGDIFVSRLTWLRREKLLYSEDFVLLVEEDDFRGVAFQLAVLAIVVAEDDDLVSDDPFPCGWAVQADLSGALLSWYRIRLKPLPVVEVTDHHLFIGQYIRLFEYGFVDGNTPLICEVGLGDRCNMYLGP
jgi:hypothetical protein